METINGRPKHGVVLILLLAVGVIVFPEQSCYGRRLYNKKDLTIKDRLAGQQITLSTMKATIKRAEEIQQTLTDKRIYKGETIPPALTELKSQIEALNKVLATIEKQIEELNIKRAELSGEVERLEGEKKALQAYNEELSRKAEELGKSIMELSKNVSDLEKDKEILERDNDVLKEDVDNLEAAKATIKAWFGGGMFTSVAGIVLLVLKIMSQKKDIMLKQIEIDAITKKKD